MAATESTQARVRCGGCPATWTALGAAHCAAIGCHRTFSSVSSFDKHRAGHECRPPQDVGLELNKRGMWAWPSDESGDSRFNRLPQSAETASAGVTGPEAA